ncbi:hypothetical protein Xen7305DRAFT_00008670 [Xenococcus sp. PCC 7305]|uniref:hypothetical protein n=1 Tax=Xenococcus sp. PCC 7305 TaxID=102125 RepID=UPI0002AC007C|nr:hypothetical protein [Xenococcus sp. PCC 7305]ELS01165.1 hypothetical protein Xen7305DRAFT_00008670 [Xenococcus sp. PCC 7305]
MFLHLNSAKKHYLIDSTYHSRFAKLHQWWAKLPEIIETFGPDSLEASFALDNLGELANLDFKLSELPPEELNEALEKIASANFQFKEEEPEGAPTKKPQEPLSIEDYQSQLTVDLVNSGLCPDLRAAIAISDITPHKLLEGYIKARLNFLNRDQINNEEAAESLMQELKDGSFFGKAEKGKDPFRDGVLQAMNIRPPKAAQAKPKLEGMPDSVKKALGL